MKKWQVGLCGFFLLVLNLCAAEKTWTGGATTNLFSSAANWSPAGAPANGDALFFTNRTDIGVINDLDSYTFSGITLSGSNPVTFQNAGKAFTLSGNINLLGPRELNIVVPITVNAAVTLNLSNASFYAYSAISGSGSLTIEGGNSFYAKDAVNLPAGVVANKGRLYIDKTTFTAPVTLNQLKTNGISYVSLSFQNSGTYNVPITIRNVDDSGQTLITASGAYVTNTAAVTLAPSTLTRWLPYGSMTYAGGIVLQDPVQTAFQGGDMSIVFNGNNIIRSVPIAFTNWVYVDNGTFRFAVAGNTYAGVKCLTKTVFTDVPFALDPNHNIAFGISYSQNGALDLNGNSQIINRPVLDTLYNLDASSYVLTSSNSPALLTCRATGSTTFFGSLDGALSLSWEPVADYAFTLTGRTSQTTGALQVKAGSLVLANGTAFPNLSGLSATSNSLLRVETSSVRSAPLTIADTAQLALPSGVALTGVTAQVYGTYLTPGVYTSASMVKGTNFITGGGTLTVQTIPLSGTVYTWTGAAGDSKFSTASNWDPNPSFDGSGTFLFTNSANSSVIVDGTNRLGALRFNRSVPVTLVPADSTASLWLGLGGITATNPIAGAPVTNTLTAPLTLTSSSEWQVATNLMLAISGTVSGGLPNAPLIKSGSGTLRMTGTNTFESPLIISNGFVNVNNSASLGNPTNTITIQYSVSTALGFSQRGPIYFNDTVVTNSRPIIMGAVGNYLGQIYPQNGTLVLNGKYTFASGGRIDNQGTLIFRGGFDSLNNTPWMQTQNGNVTRFENQPLNFGANSISLDNYGTFNVCTTNNTWASIGLFKGTFLCGAANVLPTNSFVTFGVNYAVQGFLDLNGFDQQVKFLNYNTGPGTTNMQVKSTQPATLTLQGDTSVRPFIGYFAGKASLRHRNSGTLAFTAPPSASTTAGDLVIEAGTVAFRTGATWTGSTNITVTAGTLSLEGGNGTTFGGNTLTNMTRLNLTSSSIVNVAAGVTEYVYAATLNGKYLPVGSYGSPTSSAQYKSSLFTGTGILYIMRSKAPGTLVRVL